MLKKIIPILSLLLFTHCQQKELLSYDNVFETPLGIEQGQIGSNIPILKSYTNRQGFTDAFLIDVPILKIYHNKIYVADSYNKRISVFSLEHVTPENLLLTISNKGVDYSFSRPYDVYIDPYDDIYVLASLEDIESYEIQNYSNLTANIDNYNEFQKSFAKIPINNFHLFKFSSQGDFLYRIGINGINSSPFPYPTHINGDNFGNVYLSFLPSTTMEEEFYHIVKRYSPTGTLNFEFNSKTINITTNINGTNYQGSIMSINNYKHDEQLVILTEYQPTTNDKGEQIPALIDNIWSSVNIYSILENDFTQEVLKNESLTESIVGIDQEGKIFFQSYNPEDSSLKIRILNPIEQSTQFYYAPIHSSYYTIYDYLIDEEGTIYNYLVDRNEKLIVLRWNQEEI